MAKPTWDNTKEITPTWDSTVEMPVAPQAQGQAGATTGAENQERPWYAVEPENLVPGFFKGLETIDKYTGAPVRKFITETVTGRELENAPTGAEQAKMMGASDVSYRESLGVPSYLGGNISPADIYGAGLEVVQDPLVIGSGIKKIFQGGKALISPLTREASAKLAQSAKSTADATAKVSANIGGGDLVVEQGGQMFKYKPPESLEELRQWKPKPSVGELPGKGRLEEIVNTVPDLETKPLKYHYTMMDNPKSMKELKLKFENLPTEDAKKIAAYNQEIVDESSRKIIGTVEDMSGAEPRSLHDSGNDFISTVKEKYNADKKALGPIFEQVQNRAKTLNKNESKDLIVGLGENTKIGKLLAQNEEGRFYLENNSPRTGLSDSEHKVLSRLVDDLNDGMTFKEIQRARDFLRKSVDPMNPAASSEINKVRSIMLGQLEEMATKIDPEIGKTFKNYAINERNRESIEKIIGGKIDTLDSMYAANPDRVVKKVLSNPNYTKIVAEYVGPEKMNQMMASYIKTGIEKATDSAKGFAPHTFKTWLKSNATILNANVSPEVLNRLNSLADYGYFGKRFLDEVNPSGTAASLKAMIEPMDFMQKVKQSGITGAIASEVGSRAKSAIKQKSSIKSVDEMLGTVKAKPKNPSSASDSVKMSELLDKAAKFQGSSAAIRSLKPDEKLKGTDKWANDGADKLLEHAKTPEQKMLIEKIKGLKSQKAKRLFISASDLKPGSKSMDNVMKQIIKVGE
jgi:hypothetical protein